MLKKLILSVAAVMMAVGTSFAQIPSFGMFNHLGADLSVSTNGIGVELSTPITSFVQVRAGVSFIPKVTFNTNVDGTVDVTVAGQQQQESFDMDITGDVARTQGSVIFNVYPFGSLNSLFVAAGAYFGGKNIIKLDGHSSKVAELQQLGQLNQGYVEIGDYQLDFDKQGNIYGGLVTKNFRPYLGLGYGRPCPGKRLGFMVELGVQFMGKMKVSQGKDMQELNVADLGNDDDWQKWIDKLQVYPVLKFTLSGRIL